MLALTVLVAVTLLDFSLALLVLSRNHRHWTNRSFAFFACAIAVWALTQVTRLLGLEPATLWARVSFLSGGLSAFGLALFFHTFPSNNALPRSRPFLLLVASAFSIASLSLFSPWIVQSASSTTGHRIVQYGPLYRYFAFYVLCAVAYSLALLVYRIRRTTGTARYQLIYLFFAILLPGVLAFTTNVLLPLFQGSSAASIYGPTFSVVMIAMIAHAIIRHRLMNIRLVVRSGVVYLLSVAVAAAVFSSAIWLTASFAPRPLREMSIAVQVVAALLVALCFHPFKNFVQARLDRYVYRESYNYPALVREASTRISGILDLNHLVQYLSDVIGRALRPDMVSIFLHDARRDVFTRVVSKTAVSADAGSPPTTLSAASDLIGILDRSLRPLVRDDSASYGDYPIFAAAAQTLEMLGGTVALPILADNRVVGVVVLGPKRSGDAYFAADLELLTTLCSQASIALQNARLYGQVVIANQYIENILSTMDSGVIAIDSAHKVTLCNATAERLLGHRGGRISLRDLPASLRSQLEATLSDGVSRPQQDILLPATSSHSTPVVCSTSALRDAHGHITGGLAVFSDLSRLKALESEKRRAERLAAFGALVSGIAHEIKNPLVAIKTFAELLPERFDDSDFREDFSRVVRSEIDRIDDLVERLRGLAVPPPPLTKPISVTEPINDTLALLKAQFEQTRTSVRREFSERNPYVMVDGPQLKQLFLNLFLNAAEAMGFGGVITVRVAGHDTPTGRRILVSVSDTGPGIPDNIRASVFDPFFTTKPRGSGLGLAICRGIMDAHHGTIRVDVSHSTPGTTMVVEFPAASSSSYADTLAPIITA